MLFLLCLLAGLGLFVFGNLRMAVDILSRVDANLRRRKNLAFAAAGLLLMAASPLSASETDDALSSGWPLVVEANEVPLHSKDVSVREIGELRYVKGWELTSELEAFGGWSGMALQGDRLTLISDSGGWLTGTFTPDEQSPINYATFGLMPGRGLSGSEKSDFDAESLVPLPNGEFLVGFEQTHRFTHMAAPGAVMTPIPMPEEIFEDLKDNKGYEAATSDGNGGLWMFVEHGKKSGLVEGWYVHGAGDAKKANGFHLRLDADFSPTAMRQLPSGDYVVLARAYSMLRGNRIKLLKLSEDMITSAAANGSVIEGELLGELRRPYSVDNFEAMTIVPNADAGTARILIMSDDNFSRFQRTLMMMFEITL